MPIFYRAQPFPVPFTDPTTGLPISGGTLEAFINPGSITAPMYSDNLGTSVGAVVTLNSAGYPSVSGAIIDIWLDSSINYDFVLKRANGSTVWTARGFAPQPNRLSAMFSDFETNTEGTQTLTRSNFGKGTKFTHSSAIVLTIPESVILEGDGPCLIWYPATQTATISINAESPATVEGGGPYSPGALLAIYRLEDNTFKVGGV